jgi:hypothetical protein
VAANIAGRASGYQLVIRLAQPIGPADQALAGAVHEHVTPLFVLEEYAAGRVLHEGTEALLGFGAALPGALHRAAEPGNEERRHGIGDDLDRILHAAQVELPARLDEQQLRRDPCRRGGEERRAGAAIPGGDDDRAEHRDIGHARTEPRIERGAQGQRRADGGKRDQVR